MTGPPGAGPGPVDPGPAPTPPPPPAAPPSTGPEVGTDPTAFAPTGPDGGGWAATASQGLLIARWVAAELAAQRVEGFAFVAWIAGAVGLGCLGLSLPVDPGWPLVVLGVLLVLLAVAGRLALALAAAVLRHLALPRRARHLRGEAAAARGRLRDAMADSGVPVSLGAAVRFVVALARGRRPHAGVAGNLRALAGQLDRVPEIERLRASLAAAAPAPTWLSRGRRRDGEPGPGAR